MKDTSSLQLPLTGGSNKDVLNVNGNLNMSTHGN